MVKFDTATSQWRYRRDVFRAALLQRMRAFHSDSTLVRCCTAPTWALLVDKMPFLACDADYAWQTCALPLHQVLIYTDVARWMATLHHAYAMQVDSAIAERGDMASLLHHTAGLRTAIELYAVAVHTFRPLMVRIQGIDEKIAREKQAQIDSGRPPSKLSPAELAERQARISTAYNTLDALLLDSAAAFLPWLFNEPGVLIAGGTNYRFRKGGSVSIHVGGNDERRGMWKDFQSGQGGRGFVRLLRYVRHGDKQPMRVAYSECRQWLVDHYNNSNDKGTALPAFGNDAFFMNYYSNSALLLGAAKIELIQRYSEPVRAGDHVMRYLCGTRGLGGVITPRLLEQWRAKDLLRCAPQDRYYNNGGGGSDGSGSGSNSNKDDFIKTPAMLLWMYTPDGRRGRLQRTYLHEDAASGRVQKLRIPKSPDTPNEFLPSKKFRSCLEDASNSFAWIQASSIDGAPLMLAEGLETALSVATALPEANVFVSGGVSSFKHFDWRTVLPSSRVVVLCRDNDRGVARVNTDESARQSVELLSQRDYQVHEVFPTDEQRFKDFNDVSQAYPGRAGAAMVADMLCSQLPLLRQCLGAQTLLLAPSSLPSSSSTLLSSSSPPSPTATTINNSGQ